MIKLYDRLYHGFKNDSFEEYITSGYLGDLVP